jgi:thiamine biosynthesis lipoprotein
MFYICFWGGSNLSCKKDFNDSTNISSEFNALGTINKLTLYDGEIAVAINEAMDRVYDIDDKMSVFKEESCISKINRNAGGLPQKVSKDTYYVIERAKYFSELTLGLFDPTIRPLVGLWGINTRHARVPNKNEIITALKLVNYKDIVLNNSDYTVKLNNDKQCLDLGAIAKGYAADEVKIILMKNNVKSAIIDLGGNIFAMGGRPDGSHWTIGIQDPLSFQGDYIGTTNVTDKSIVTSGDYERYFVSNEKKYHHIIDSRTGYPSENGIISVTIISDNSIEGDALSTCAYIMGIKKGLKLIESLKGIDAIFITKDKRVYTTEGLINKFHLCNKEYILN